MPSLPLDGIPELRHQGRGWWQLLRRSGLQNRRKYKAFVLNSQLLSAIKWFSAQSGDNLFTRLRSIFWSLMHQDFPDLGFILENVVTMPKHCLLFVLALLVGDFSLYYAERIVFIVLSVASNPIGCVLVWRSLEKKAFAHCLL